jgi:hypothetical protein
MASGEVVSGLNPDYYLSFKGNENLQVGNIVLSVTTDIARNIYLPKLDSSFARFATGSLHIYIVDVTGSASTNNISVYPHPDDRINSLAFGAPLVINTNRDVVDILSVGYNKWATSSYNGGSGGGGGSDVNVKDFDITIPFARVQALLNDDTLFDTAIAAPASNQIIEVITSNMGFTDYGGTPYDGTEPKIILCSVVADIKSLLFTTLGNDLTQDYTGAPQYTSLVMTRRASIAPYSGASTFNFGGNGVYIRSYDNYIVTQGNTDLRFFGTYRIKTMN